MAFFIPKGKCRFKPLGGGQSQESILFLWDLCFFFQSTKWNLMSWFELIWLIDLKIYKDLLIFWLLYGFIFGPSLQGTCYLCGEEARKIGRLPPAGMTLDMVPTSLGRRMVDKPILLTSQLQFCSSPQSTSSSFQARVLLPQCGGIAYHGNLFAIFLDII